jgi:NAD(P)-dependent dehydrogenase (short-subunit alcohol dehydrogenase family)
MGESAAMRVFVTGSAEGLGQMAAARLVSAGHEVILHARNQTRARQALEATPGAADALVGDLASLQETKELAQTANATGRFDAVIHNAGVGFRERLRRTEEGLPHVLAINLLAPYVLTSLMTRPDRLVYLTSGMHRGGDPDLSDLGWERRSWNGAQAYSDSKLYDLILAFAVARHWHEVLANAVAPGWVATKMGGSGAPDDLAAGSETQAWLAVSHDPEALLSGRLLYHRQPQEHHPAADDANLQDELLSQSAELTGVPFPLA